MKKLLLTAAAGLLIASAALADSPCPIGNLGLYMNANGTSNGFTCNIGNLDFSNFSETFSPNPGGNGPAQITANPITLAGDQGFTFSAFWSAVNLSGNPANNQSEDSTIFYTVTDLSGAFIDDLGLGFNGGFSGTGQSSVTEKYCTTGSSVLSCPGGAATIQVTNPPTVLNQNFVFSSLVTTVSVSKDIGVASGSNGQASISSVTNQFSNVPEPRLVSLLMLALIGGLGISKKLKSAQV